MFVYAFFIRQIVLNNIHKHERQIVLNYIHKHESVEGRASIKGRAKIKISGLILSCYMKNLSKILLRC